MANRTLGHTQEFLKQIVFGGNDGIVTTFAIVAGFAGAKAEGVVQIGSLAVLLFGLANLFADAVSMGLGEFLSSRARRDLYHGRHAALMQRLTRESRTGQATLAGLLRDRGLSSTDADAASALIARQPKLLAEMIMRYEAGMSHPDADTPALSGLVTFLSFITFGVLPLIPYFLYEPTTTTFQLSCLATISALIILGLLRGNATGTRLGRAVGETVLVGGVCAIVAFLVGVIVGG
ncbi:VIT1/CCC1 transporter family protein [Actibacterium sp. D379-3]